MHGYILDGSFFVNLLIGTNFIKSDRLDFWFFAPYFKKIILNKGDKGEELSSKESKEYKEALIKIKKEYEKIKDELTIYEKNPRIRF